VASLKRLTVHLRKYAALVGSGSSMSDFSEVGLPFEIRWCSTVSKQ
jgi:hypothetical protein